jgi:hypothetical protein
MELLLYFVKGIPDSGKLNLSFRCSGIDNESVEEKVFVRLSQKSVNDNSDFVDCTNELVCNFIETDQLWIFFVICDDFMIGVNVAQFLG